MSSPPIFDPYVAAVDSLGDAWTFLITREAFFGATRFEHFQSSLQISKARLSERLKHLAATGLLSKEVYEKSRSRYDYRLTARGLDLYPIALSMIEWGRARTSLRSDVELRHSECGHPLSVKTVCRNCREEVHIQDLSWPPIIPLNQAIRDESTVRRWKKKVDAGSVSQRKDPATGMLDLVGDRWSMLIVYGALQRDFRFREAQAKLGIAHNILSARLKDLVSGGVLERVDSSRQSPYRISAAGVELLPTVLAMRTWALDHLVDESEEWNAIYHTTCGAEIRTEPWCSHCSTKVTPQSVVVSDLSST